MKNTFLIIIFLFVICKISQAQERGLNFGLTYDNYLGEEAGSGHLKGYRFSFEQEKQQFNLSGSWRVGFKYSNGNYLNDFDAVKVENYNQQNNTLSKFIKVEGKTNYRTWQFEITQKMYLFNKNMQYGGPYILAGIGFNITGYETKFSHDKTEYRVPSIKENNYEINRQFTAYFGAGYDINLDILSLFIESDYNIPYLTIQDEDLFEFEVKDATFKFWSVAIGLRLHLREL